MYIALYISTAVDLLTLGTAGATSSEGTSEEMAVSEPQREGEEEERQREGEGEEESRGEEMESQSAAVAAVEATGEELTTPMEESPSSGSSVQGSISDITNLAPPLLTPSVQEQPHQEPTASPVPSPGRSLCVYAVKICVQ